MFNNGFISQSYLKSVISKIKGEKVKTSINGIRMFFQDVRAYIEKDISKEEYSLEEYIDDYIISCVGTLFNFNQLVDSDSNFKLYADSVREQPIGTLFTLHYSDDISSETKGKNFGFSAIQLARKEKLRWAFLTNGLIWRIYDANSVSPYETYLEMNLTDVLFSISEINDDAKLFSVFCQAKSYYSDSVDAKSQIEVYFENSEKEMEKLENVLKGKIEQIVTDISYGFIQSIGKDQYSDIERRKIFEDSIILLYRMLFIQYAESRALFPMDNETYVKQSFESLAQSAKELYHSGNLANYNDSYTLWRQLDLLRGYINSGWDDIDMKAYNGGLFDNEHHDILNSYSISDTFFAEVLCGLSFIKDKNGSFTDRIEYKDLSVRSLGGLYEGLLEFNLFIAEEELVRRSAKGKVAYIPTAETTVKQSERNSIISMGEIYLSQDALERKETGSYYTPEDVVNYIIENTVGKKLEEIRTQFTQLLGSEDSRLLTAINTTETQAIQNSIDQKVNEFIHKNVLTLSVLDNSMGSGHFLVNTAHYISNFIMEIVHSTEWESEYLNGELSYWKIQVVSHCIFGIDINPLALHLGKLSLWLVSAAKNKPLSFMDHHLKVGNSLIGIDKRKVEKQINDWTNGEYNIFTASYNNVIENVLNKYSKISQMPEETRDQVHAKKDLYDEINSEVELLKKKFDVYLGMIQVDGKVHEESFLKLLNYNESELVWNIDEYKEYLLQAQKQQYFHWDLEFPDMMDKGGFDIVIGNPPYVELKDCTYTPTVYTVGNLYTSFVMQALRRLSPEGVYGFIIPMSSISTDRTEPFQKVLIENSSNLHIANFSWRPGKIFDGVNLQVSIIYGNKKEAQNSPLKAPIYTTKYNIWRPNERKELFNKLKYTDASQYLWSGSIPKLSFEIEKKILNKMKVKNKKFKAFTQKKSENILYYRRGGLYYKIFTNFMTGSSEEKIFNLKDDVKLNAVTAIFNSSTWFWFFTVFSDCRHVGRREIEEFPIDFNTIQSNLYSELERLGLELNNDYKKNSVIKTRVYKGIKEVECYQFYAKDSIQIIDEIDTIIGRYYEFTDEEINFIKNYNRSYRLYDLEEEAENLE